jgi:hypothetical protein
MTLGPRADDPARPLREELRRGARLHAAPAGDRSSALRSAAGAGAPQAAGGSSLASRDGWVKVICGGPPNADCSAKLTALEGKLELAQVPVTRIGQGSKVVLELKLTDEARALLASSDRMPALLETTVTDEKGPVCRNVFSSILTRHDSR